MRFKYAYNNFASGELSPIAQGRPDSDEYKGGLSIMENMVTYPTGGARRRSGTIVYATNYSPSRSLVGFPFQAQDGSAYSLIMHTQSSSTPNTFVDLDVVIERTLDDVQEGPEGTTYPFLSIDSIAIENSPGPYNQTDYEHINYAQSGDDMWLVHPYMPPKLVRYSGGGFLHYRYDNKSQFSGVFDTADWEKARAKVIPFRDANVTGETLRITAVSGSTVGLISSLGSSRRFYQNEYYKITTNSNATTGMCVITVGGTSSATVDILVPFANTTAQTTWQRSCWGGGATETGLSGFPGYPRTVAIFQGRLLYGGSVEFPDTIWMSEDQNFQRFTLSNQSFAQWAAGELQTGNAGAAQFDINSDHGAPIQWMKAREKLAIGTGLDELTLFGPDTTQGIGPSNFQFQRHTNYGSNRCQPVIADDFIVFASKDGRTVRGSLFSEEQQTFRAVPLNTFSSHLVPHRTRALHPAPLHAIGTGQPEIVRMAHQASNGVTWLNDSFGGLSGLTLNAEEKIVSWHYHVIGGSLTGDLNSSSATSPPKVQGVWTTGDPYLAGELLWMFVNRTVNGVDTVELEYMPSEYLGASINDEGVIEGDTSQQYAFQKPVFVDSAVVKMAPALITVAASDVGAATDTITYANTDIWNGMVFKYSVATGTLVGLTDATNYFVRDRTASTFKVAPTLNGTAIDITMASGSVIFAPQPSTQFTGFGHLSGQTVKVLADGGYVGDYSVSTSTITLDYSASSIIAGLGYTHKLKTTRLEAGSMFQMSQGDIKAIDQATIRFHRTGSCSFGRDENKTQFTINLRNSTQAMDSPTELFSGDKTVDFPQGADRNAYVYVQGSDPLPCAIAGIFVRGITYD